MEKDFDCAKTAKEIWRLSLIVDSKTTSEEEKDQAAEDLLQMASSLGFLELVAVDDYLARMTAEEQ